jgi:hypothetical protein
MDSRVPRTLGNFDQPRLSWTGPSAGISPCTERFATVSSTYQQRTDSVSIIYGSKIQIIPCSPSFSAMVI